MPYLQELMRQSRISSNQPVGYDLGLPRGHAYSSYYPTYEVQSPQYITPNTWSLAQEGYRTNEVIYACIAKRAKSFSQAPLLEWFDTTEDEEEPKEVKGSMIRKLLKNANEGIGEKTFFEIHEIFKAIAGFAAWEIETDNLGLPIRLWPMLPHYCSFLRGERKPLRAIRYQPYGLPPQDIPIERVLLDGYFDPLYPLLKFYSPTMNALRQVGVDNKMTEFLFDFIKHGAKFSGLLSVAQTIDETTAQDYKRRFKDAHGGSQNWTDPLVLGLGAKYESMQMNFNDMAFPEIDARTEARICMVFEISPILIGAKVGMDRSTYSNYKEAKTAWYDEWVIPEWELTADVIGKKLLPFFYDKNSAGNYFVKFDTRRVPALQEDRTEQVNRSVNMYRAGVANKNEAREEVGLDPLIDGNDFYGESNSKLPMPEPAEENAVPESMMDKNAVEEMDKIDEEVKHFRLFARRRIKEGKSGDIPLFEFKYVPPHRASELIHAALAEDVVSKLNKVMDE